MVRVRMKDVDPSLSRYAVASETRGIVTVRNGKGDKDRTTILPESLRGVVAETRRGWYLGKDRFKDKRLKMPERPTRTTGWRHLPG